MLTRRTFTVSEEPKDEKAALKSFLDLRKTVAEFFAWLNTPGALYLTQAAVEKSTVDDSPVGATTPSTGSFTTLTTSSTVTHNGGTANGVAYLNGSKALTTGTAFVFDGTNVGIGTSSPTNILSFGGNSARTVWMERHTTANTAGNSLTLQAGGATSGATDKAGGNLVLSSGTATGTGASQIIFSTAAAGAAGTADRAPAERVRIDGAGNVGIGTNAPGAKLHTFGKVRSSDTSTSGVGTASGVFELGDTANGLWRGDINGSITTAGNYTALGGYSGIIFTCSNHAIGSQTERLRITDDGRFYGTALHNNSGSVTGTTNQYLASGTTASGNATAVTNITGTPTYQTLTWMRVGNVVTVAGSVTAAATTANTASEIRFAPPIASAFTVAEDCGGSGTWTTGDNGAPVRVRADAANDHIAVRWVPTSTDSTVIAIHFTYLIK